MTREEKCQLAIEKGFTYNPETGEVISRFGNVIKNKTKSDGYIKLAIYDKNTKRYFIYGHQFAWYVTYGEIVEQIDHINGIKDDNRISNLRGVTNQQNHFNRTKAKGYCWNKPTNNWKAQIKLNDKTIYLGYFNTEDEAREAYLVAKEQYHKF